MTHIVLTYHSLGKQKVRIWDANSKKRGQTAVSIKKIKPCK